MQQAFFKLKRCDWLIGKDSTSGRVPLWSYITYWSFHATNWIYIHIAKAIRVWYVDNANEVAPNFWIGNWWVDSVSGVAEWEAILDLTTEFPERGNAKHYLNLPTWDGNAPSPARIQQGAEFIVKHAKNGPCNIHCGYGVGRSTTVMCATLVVAGLYDNYLAAFEHIKTKRKIVRLNKHMRATLEEWQAEFDLKRK